MLQYIVRRLLIAIPMLLGAMSIVFFAMRILPGDPCLAMMGDEATRAALQDCIRQLGLDRPLLVQYLDYLWKSLQLDFGRSLLFNYTVSSYILRMFPHTLLLVIASTIIALCIGLPTGIISALNRRNPLIDYTSRIVALIGLSMPVFWFGILLLIAFSLYWDLFPLIGGGDLSTVLEMLGNGEVFEYPEDFFAAVLDVLHHLVLPAFALGITLAATVSRLSRSAMLEVISQDYIRTARSKGLPERVVIYKHALRNMMIPLLTIIGLFVAIALTGTVLTETVFSRPGLGKMLVDAIGARDYPLAQGAITVFTMTIIVVNLIVDVLYAVFDPRITYR
ncbi:MAG: peptide ABC transporter permease [Candidatus Tectimicrobiota bacterium]|nr:MAG: peptide ABC transporter permease [Candidatus Tectomicrobia bacterium]